MNCILTRQEYNLSLFYPKEGKRTRIYLKKMTSSISMLNGTFDDVYRPQLLLIYQFFLALYKL